MMKKNDPNKKNRRKNKKRPKSKFNNKDMYDLSNYFAEELVKNISDENKQKFADGIQMLLDRNKENEKK
ncbi:MAG: hypothetical protein J7J96_06315 [Sulfurimonas sp.]|nr:hypothetical protein [Sulfurimonas sp.]